MKVYVCFEYRVWGEKTIKVVDTLEKAKAWASEPNRLYEHDYYVFDVE